MPFTRGCLYLTNYLAGLCVLWAPITLSFAVLSLMSGAGCLAALPYMLLITAAHLALFNLSATLTGNSATHIIVCGFLTFAAPALLVIFREYCRELLAGYNPGAQEDSLLLSLTPLTYFMSGKRAGFTAPVAAFTAAVPSLFALGSLAYSRRRLEKAGDGVVFRFFEVVFVTVVTFAAMSVVWFITRMAYNGDGMLGIVNVWTIFASVSVFLILRMIVRKSVRIWDKPTLFQFTGFVAAAAVFLAALSADITGFELRMPPPGRVESVNVNFGSLLPNRLSSPYYGGYYVFTNAENIRTIMDIHRRFAAAAREDGDTPRSQRYSPRAMTFGLDYEYYKAGGMSRAWTLPAALVAGDEGIRSILESDEFKELNSLSDERLGIVQSIQLADAVDNIHITLSSDDFSGFLDALNSDMRTETAEDMLDGDGYIGVTVERALPRDPNSGKVVYASPQSGAYYPENYEITYTYLSIPDSYVSTVSWLRANGYYERLSAWRGNITGIALRPADISYTSASEDEAALPHTDAPEAIALALDSVAPAYRLSEADYWTVLFFADPDFMGHDRYDYAGTNYGYGDVILELMISADDPSLQELLKFCEK
jgi:hypothetical protein